MDSKNQFAVLKDRLPSGLRIARALTCFCSILACSALLLLRVSADDKRLTIYSNAASYSIPVIDRNGQEYVGLLEAIDPVGSVSASAQGSHWRLRYNATESEFTEGSSHARVRGADFDLRANFLLENGRGIVPVASLGNLMSKILGGPVTLHEAARRVFIGSVAIHFTAQMTKAAPPTLVMNFTAPVNPMIATEPGKLMMVFSRDPLVAPGSPSLTFDSKAIPSASYLEENGSAALTVNGTAPLFASFSNGNRTITIAAAVQPETAQGSNAAPPPQPQATAPQAPPLISAAPPPTSPTNPGRAAAPYFAVIDASHGGSDRGEDLAGGLEEKDVALSLARVLRQELQARGISVLLIRDGAITLSLDQRASMTNMVHPVIYIAVHASSEGRGVRLYTALLPLGGRSAGIFVDWDTAQSAFLSLSETGASGIETELQRKQVPVRKLMAPLRPLNNIATAALAMEVAPPAEGKPDVSLPSYQQLIASGVANGLLSVRGRLEAGR